MAEAMNMTVDKFKEKLEKSANSAKRKTCDSAQTKKELKKLQKQVKEMQESQMTQSAKSDSDATEDSGWGSDNDSNRSNLCELVPQVNELLAVHNSDSADAFDNGEAAKAEGCDFEMTIEGDRSSDDIVSLWDSDESDIDIHDGQRVVHAINMDQRSKKGKETDKGKDSLRKSRQSKSDSRLQETVKRPGNTSEEARPKDELTSDAYRSDKHAHIDKC